MSSSLASWRLESANLLIDGTLRPGRGSEFPTVNPATEEVLGTAANADTADLDEAIGAADHGIGALLFEEYLETKLVAEPA